MAVPGPEVAPAPFDPMPNDAPPAAPVAGVGPLVRVALRVTRDTATLDATGPWRLVDAPGGVLVRSRPAERWQIERRGRQLRAVRADGTATGWRDAALSQFPENSGLARSGGKDYRGALIFVATDTGILVVNLLPL